MFAMAAQRYVALPDCAARCAPTARTCPHSAPRGSYLLELEVNPVRNSTTSSCNASCVAPT